MTNITQDMTLGYMWQENPQWKHVWVDSIPQQGANGPIDGDHFPCPVTADRFLEGWL